MSVDQLYQNLDSPLDIIYKSVVRIKTETGASGSGFLFHTPFTQGHHKPMIVTCHHVIENAKQITLEWYNNVLDEHQCDNLQILISDVARDFSIVTSDDLTVLGQIPIDIGNQRFFFKLGETGRNSLKPSTQSLPSIGSTIYAAGYPLGSKYPQFIGGIISGREDISINGVGIPSLVINAAINRGMSGGPVCDSNGDVVGIVFGMPQMHRIDSQIKGSADPIEILKQTIAEQIENVTHSGMGYAVPIGDVQILLNHARDLEYKVGRMYQKLLSIKIPQHSLARFQKYANDHFHTPIPLLSCNKRREIWSAEGYSYRVSPNQRHHLHHIFSDILDVMVRTVLANRTSGGRFILTGSHLCMFHTQTKKYELIARIELT